MSSLHLVSSSNGVRPLSALAEATRGTVVDVRHSGGSLEVRIDRLLALGITPGAAVTVLQTFPGVVFLCDQTELAVERAVADAILVRPVENAS